MLDYTWEHWREILAYLAWGSAFGLAGGIVRALRRGVRGWLDMLAQCVVAAFCGALAFGLLSGHVPELALAAVAGIAGNSGGMLLDALRWRLIRKAAGLDAVAVPSSVKDEAAETESFARKTAEDAPVEGKADRED